MKWSSEGDKAGQFNVPYSIEIDPLDNIYVLDRGNDRIQNLMEMVLLSNNGVRKGKDRENSHLC